MLRIVLLVWALWSFSETMESDGVGDGRPMLGPGIEDGRGHGSSFDGGGRGLANGVVS